MSRPAWNLISARRMFFGVRTRFVSGESFSAVLEEAACAGARGRAGPATGAAALSLVVRLRGGVKVFLDARRCS